MIQTVVLAELDGLHTPNRNGDLPLFDDDPTRPNEAYFAHVDAVLDLAAALGLHLCLPDVGRQVEHQVGGWPEIFTPENARCLWPLFLGQRYRSKPLIWIVGGDRPIESETHRLIVRSLAEGLREGDVGEHLITMHTWGQHSTSEMSHARRLAGFSHLPERPRPQCGQLADDRGRLCGHAYPPLPGRRAGL